MPLLELKEAGKHYVPARFNVAVERHRFILVSGANGQGKTTLIRLLLGYVRPDHGSRTGHGVKIGYLPEQIMLPRFINVQTYIETLARLKKTTVDETLIHDFEIPLFKSIHALSKGNQQKLALVSTFMGGPDLVILDEPLSGLDVKSRHVVKRVLAEKKAAGLALVVATHQPKFFLSLADEHLVL